MFPAASVEEAVSRKDDPLLALLRSVYVDSTDPAPAEVRRGHRDMLGSILLSQSHTLYKQQTTASRIYPESNFPFTGFGYYYWFQHVGSVVNFLPILLRFLFKYGI